MFESIAGPEASKEQVAVSGFASIFVQIAVLDLVFSLNSVITAVGVMLNIKLRSRKTQDFRTLQLSKKIFDEKES